ncbi:MAG: PEP/pyruvate-binding domain-containing protein [Elusimicrobiota bacterium]
MNAISRRLLLISAFSACLPNVLWGQVTSVPAGLAGPSFSATQVNGWAIALDGFFGSKDPDLTSLHPMMASLQGVDLSAPQTRQMLAPVYSRVQFEAHYLPMSCVTGESAAPANPALAQQLIIVDALKEFQNPESRSRIAELSRSYYGALPALARQQLKAQLVMLKMNAIVEALGRPAADSTAIGARGESAGKPSGMPASWKLQPSTAKAKETPAPPAEEHAPLSAEEGSKFLSARRDAPIRFRTAYGDMLTLDKYSAKDAEIPALIKDGNLILYRGPEDFFVALPPGGAFQAYEAELAALVEEGLAVKRKAEEGMGAFTRARDDHARLQDLSEAFITVDRIGAQIESRVSRWGKARTALRERYLWASGPKRIFDAVIRSADPGRKLDFSFYGLISGQVYYQTPSGETVLVPGDFSEALRTGNFTIYRRVRGDGFTLTTRDSSPLRPHEAQMAALIAQGETIRREMETGLAAAADKLRTGGDLAAVAAAVRDLKRDVESQESRWSRKSGEVLESVEGSTNREFVRRVLASAAPESGKREITLRSAIMKVYTNADDLLETLYPRQIGELRALFPLREWSVSDFDRSLFVDQKTVLALIENRKRYPGQKGAGEEEGLSSAGFLLPVEAGAPRGEDRMYVLPYPVAAAGDLVRAAPAREVYAAFVPDIATDESKIALKRRFDVFNQLIETNFRVLPMMNKLSSLPKSAARAFISEVGTMVAQFETLTGDHGVVPEGERVRERFDSVVAEISNLWKDLPDGAPLPPEIVERLGRLEAGAPLAQIKNLHTLINYMHQKSFSALGGDPEGMRNGSGKITLNNQTPFLDIGDEPLLQGQRLRSKPLEALLRIEKRPGDHQTDTLIVRGDETWAHASLGLHSAEIYVKFDDPDDGGMLRMRYQEGDNAPIGNPLRLALIKAILERWGVHTEVEDRRHLLAVIDKDHGLTSENQLSELFPVILQALHSSLDMNLGFDNMTLEEGHALIPGLAEMYVAEGRWTSRDWINDYDFKLHLEQYRLPEQRAKRESVRAALNAELNRLGQSPIPADIPFGQATIDRYFTQTIERAVVRGELRLDKNGVPRRMTYRPVEELAGSVLKDEKRAAGTASVLDSFLADAEYEPIGAVGALRAERAVRRFGKKALVVHGLREAETGRLGYARAQAYDPVSGLRDLTVDGLREFLAEQGQDAPSPAPLSAAQSKTLELQLRAPLVRPLLSGRLVEGLAASPGLGGFVTAEATFDRDGKSGGVLFVPFTTPDDIDAIKKSAAVVTTGGGLLSHAAITTRELGIQSVLLPSARWVKEPDGGAALELTVYEPEQEQKYPGLVISPRLKVHRARLREGDLVRVNGSTGEMSLLAQGEIAAGRRFLKDPTREPLPAAAARFVVEEALFNPVYAARRTGILNTLRSSNRETMDEVRAHGHRILESLLKKATASVDPQAAPNAASLAALERSIAQLEGLARQFGAEPRMLDDLRTAARKQRESLGAAETAEFHRLYIEAGRLAAQEDMGVEDLPALRRAIKLMERAVERKLAPNAAGQTLSTLQRREEELSGLKKRSIARMAPAVLPLGVVDDDYRALVGGKLSKLGEVLAVVRREGGYVPEAIAATTEAYLRFLKENGLDAKLRELAHEIDATLSSESLPEKRKQEEVSRLSKEARDLLLSGRLDAEHGVGREIWEAMKARGLDDPSKRLAIRSSAVQEDQADAAFAGAAESYLHVKPEEALHKIVENWTSFWLPRGISYRHEHGIASADLLPATIIQEMAQADVAGVIFTQNPVTGDDEIVINSAFGLGEGIVSGIVQTDRYVVSKSNGEETLLPFLGDKRIAVMPKAEGSGTEIKGIERARRKRRSLTPEQTRRLSRIAKALENHFGYPLDIEFAVKGDRIAILQARPVTTRNSAPAPKIRSIAFVCAGNACRSPVAEYLAKEQLKDGDSGIKIISRGVYAREGGIMTPLSAEFLAKRGVDGSAHQSAPLTGEDIETTDLILAMDQSNLDAILDKYPHAKGKAFLLKDYAGTGKGDVANPFPIAGALYGRSGLEIRKSVQAAIARAKAAGVIPQASITFVCEDNSCTSPMAEYFSKDILEKDGGSGVKIRSRGIEPSGAKWMSDSAYWVLKDAKINADDHRVAQLAETDVTGSDLILAMDEASRKKIIARYPQAAAKTFLLSDFAQNGKKGDFVDPAQEARAVYERAGSEIAEAVRETIRKTSP